MLSKIQRFEDLIAWQKARDLTRVIYLLTRQEPFAKDFSYVALDVGYLDQETFSDLLARAEEVAEIVGGLRSSVATQRDDQ